MTWTTTIALLLILLKQFYKLFIHHKPDLIDYFKAVAALPQDVSFLVVSLFVKAAAHASATAEQLMALLIAYLISSIVTTLLWRVCDGAVSDRIGGHFMWAFPLNAALAGTTFYLAIQFVG